MAVYRWSGVVVASFALVFGVVTAALSSPDDPPTPIEKKASLGIGRSDSDFLIRTLESAQHQGLGVPPSQTDMIASLLGSLDPAVRSQGEVELRKAVLAYAGAQHGGRLDWRRFRKDWAMRPAAYDARADLEAALSGGTLTAWTEGLPPPEPRYALLVAAYGRYLDIAAHGGWPTLPTKPDLKPGAVGSGVTALRARLAIEDALVAAPSAEQDRAVYDGALTQAVARAQMRYGLNPNGAADPATLKALNVPATQRLAQIGANLERWRWAPRGLPSYRIELNIADANLILFDGGQPALAMRAIVGRPAKPTPMFQDQIQAVVFNPPWNVPAEIAAKEIWPKIRRDPGYMKREGFVVKPGGGLQQLPGPKCALGTIKFDLSNPFGVYLHDTPTHSLFARDDRALSHGCMRLDEPYPLARRLLQGDPTWSQTRIDMALLSGSTVRAGLHQPVPVYVFYWTAFVDDQGQVRFRPDIYGWDEALLRLL